MAMSLDAPSIGAADCPRQPPGVDDDRVAEAGAFLSALHGDAPAGVFVGIMRGGSFGAGEWRPAGPDAFAELARVAVGLRDDVYVTVAPMSNRRRRAADCAALTCLWHELDGPDTPARLAVLEAATGRASVVVASGGGLHVYWTLAAPVTGAEAIRATLAAWRGRLHELGAVAKGEKVHDAARVLRVPGTFNAKPERRDSDGNAPAVRLLRCEPSTRYAAAELAPPRPEADAPIAPRLAPVTTPAAMTPYGRAALLGECIRLAETEPGERHRAAVRAGFRLGQIAERHALDVETVTARLLAACHENGRIRDDGHAAARRDILDGWAGGLAAPDDRGADGDGAAWAEHVAAVDAWTSAAAVVVERHGKRRTRTSDGAIIAAMGDIAIAAGPGCSKNGAVVVDASRHRLARLTGLAPETCRRSPGRLTALGVVELAAAGGLRGYDVTLDRARKVSNAWRFRFVQGVAEMSYELGAGGEPGMPTESTRGASRAIMGGTTATHCTNPFRLGPCQDALTAALGGTRAAIFRAMLAAGEPCSADELAEAVGCSRSTACRAAPRLIALGIAASAGERVNDRARPSPLFVAAVGSEAEAVAVTRAEDVQAAIAERRVRDAEAMTAKATARTADSYARKVNAAAGQYRKPAPAQVVELAAEIRREPLADGAVAAPALRFVGSEIRRRRFGVGVSTMAPAMAAAS